MEILDKLFGGIAKVRALRLLLLNSEEVFSVAEIASRTQTKQKDVRREASMFEKIGLVKKRATTYNRRKTQGYIIDPSFPYLEELTEFITRARPMSDKEMVRKISRAGRIKMIVLSGIFLKKDEGSRVDLLIVGDALRSKPLMNAISAIEADVGKELRYASFETTDFKYRRSIYDKLIRDIFDYPHIVIHNKM